MSTDNTWSIVNTRHDAHSLGQHNSVFTVSNGYLGLKGNVCADRDGYQPVTLINGVYDELDMFSLIRASNQERRYLDPAHFDTAGKSPAVANLPNPLFIRVFVGGRELTLTGGTVVDFRQSLDLSCGLYAYDFAVRDLAGRTTRIIMQRFADLLHPHRVYMRYSVTPLDHAAEIRLCSGIDGTVRSNTTGERQYRVTAMRAEPAERLGLTAHTPGRGHEIHMGVVSVLCGGRPRSSPRAVLAHQGVHTEYEFSPARGETITLDRCVVLACSEDSRHGRPVDLEAELDAALGTGFDAALAAQRAAWADLWAQSDVRIEGDEQAQRYLRFCLYHLLAAAPRHAAELSVPVKLLTGEYYQGNTFYDTDVYILPFYTFTQPAVARTCLNWRWRGLEPGREIARNLGYRGAKLAWQAGPRGEECLGRWWRFTHTNIHINSDAAYALVQYVWATGDEAFLRERGVDLLVDTARFLATRAVCDAGRDACDLCDVAGPDEGHCASTNNFYTNYLAIQHLRWAAESVERLQATDPAGFAVLSRRLELTDDEPARWRYVAGRLPLLFDPATGVYEQCAGFYQLKPIPEDFLSGRKVWFETVFPYQALNQPDVLMALVMFRDDFEPGIQRANWQFYKDKSLNFSSMSFVLNAIMAADMGDLDEAYRNFIISAGMDVDEELTGRRDTYAGLHGTAAGGAWMAAVFGFGGVCQSAAGLRIRPNLPSAWQGLSFKLRYRGQGLSVSIGSREVAVTAGSEPVGPVTFHLMDREVTLAAGESTRAMWR